MMNGFRSGASARGSPGPSTSAPRRSERCPDAGNPTQSPTACYFSFFFSHIPGPDFAGSSLTKIGLSTGPKTNPEVNFRTASWANLGRL